jgi:hypothetical protein
MEQASDVIILPHAIERALNESLANQISAGGYGWPSTPVPFANTQFASQDEMLEPLKNILSPAQIGTSTGTPHVIRQHWHGLRCFFVVRGPEWIPRDHKKSCRSV